MSHSHPSGNQVPSGYYDNIKGNPASLDPVPIGHPDRNLGDAANARNTRQKTGFKNAKFNVFDPKTGNRTVYDGINKAKILDKK